MLGGCSEALSVRVKTIVGSACLIIGTDVQVAKKKLVAAHSFLMESCNLRTTGEQLVSYGDTK